MRIGELAKMAGYSERDVARLEFIRSAKTLGVALEEIKEVLAFRDSGALPCPYVITLIDAKVTEIESRIRGLQVLARDLKRLKKAAASVPKDVRAAKAQFCHIIENQKLLASLATAASIQNRRQG